MQQQVQQQQQLEHLLFMLVITVVIFASFHVIFREWCQLFLTLCLDWLKVQKCILSAVSKLPRKVAMVTKIKFRHFISTFQ